MSPAEERPPAANAAAVAGLAREVEGLRRSIEPLVALPGRLEELAGIVSRLAEKLAAKAARASMTTWLRHDPSEVDAEQLLSELCGWLHEVFLRYSDAARALPECWAWHPDVVEELLWLWAAWLDAYDDPEARITSVADWHDRLRPGVVRRIRELYAKSCSIENHTEGRDRAVPATEVPLAAAVPGIAEWWRDRRDTVPPAPTEEQLEDAAAYRRPGTRGRL